MRSLNLLLAELTGASGNDMVFILTANDGKREAYTYDKKTDKAALLVVEYKVSGSTSSSNSANCMLQYIHQYFNNANGCFYDHG